MPERVDPTKINKVVKTDLKLNSKLAKPNLVTDLNIVLNKEQIEIIVKELFESGQLVDIGQVAIASDYCCVDASVGSSVAGPYSSVASSVSIDPDMRLAGLKQRLTSENVRVNVMLPQITNIR